MENEEARQELLSGISTDAGFQAAALLANASKAAAERIESVNRQVERIKTEAEENTLRQTSAIDREASTRLTAAKRRMALEMKEKTYQSVIARCLEELRALIDTEGYAKILEEWIVQAAVGLGVESAVVNCSGPERDVVRTVLKNAEAGARAVTGLPIELSLSDRPPLNSQGVMVTSSDGRIAFNNQIESRMFRFQTKIRKLIHDRLFQDS